MLPLKLTNSSKICRDVYNCDLDEDTPCRSRLMFRQNRVAYDRVGGVYVFIICLLVVIFQILYSIYRLIIEFRHKWGGGIARPV